MTDGGFGKRSSAYEYRRTGRGGQGLTAHGLGGRAGTRLAAAFPGLFVCAAPGAPLETAQPMTNCVPLTKAVSREVEEIHAQKN